MRCESQPLTLRQYHRLRVFEKKVFTKILINGPKEDEVKEGW
jgi:hypothetical protein